MTKNTVQDNLEIIRKRIAKAAIASGRNPDDIQLLLATKTVPGDIIRQAVLMGETLIGENKVQELRDKDPFLNDLGTQRHFIGHLQSNKIKEVLKYVECVQSVDRLSIAEALDQHLQKSGRSLDIMVQVNTSFEESKFGVAPADAIAFIASLQSFTRLNITGLMTIGLFSADIEKVRPSFRLLREIKDEVIAKGILEAGRFRQLSMGMSGDLETAIEEGATMVRVGTALFGKRIHADSFYWPEHPKQ